MKQQCGSVLLVSLLMMVVLTLLAVTAINTSNVNLRIVGNMQAQQEVEAIVLRAIEEVVSDISYFNVPATTPTLVVNGRDVTLAERVCLRATPATGYSAVWGLAPQNTVWEIEAASTDAVTGAQATIHQGVQILLTAGGCP